MEAAIVPFVPSGIDALASPEPDFETEAQNPGSRLRKRFRRRSSSSVTMDQPQSLLSTPNPRPESDEPQRDDQYYMCDGSCILQVGNTLFNVHRSILSRDSSSFATLFTLPQGDAPEEGTSDARPIVLQGDTANEFRNFLWALYALPQEIAMIRSSQVDLNCLIDIAKVASKYSFKSTESWALDAIQKCIERKPSPLLNTIPPGLPFSPNQPASVLQDSKMQISRLIRLAQMCDHQKLLDTMVTLLRQLMTASLHYSYLAMTLSDELDLRELRGLAYMEILQRGVFLSVPDDEGNSGTEGDIQETAGGLERLVVSPVQRLRLLSGYYRLSKTWERLRAVPLSFDHAPSCAANWHLHTCTQSWSDFWKEKARTDGILSLDVANVIGRLTHMAKEFDKWGTATYMHQECKVVAKRAIHEKIKNIQESLPDFFQEGEY